MWLRKCNENNIAVIAKLGWKIISNKNDLWIKVMKSKYKIPPNPSSWKKRFGGSHIWRGIFKAKGVLKDSSRWVIGNGSNVDLWNDWWCGKTSFAKREHNLAHICNTTTISDVIDNNGNWKINEIRSILPREWVEEITSTPLP